MAELMPGSEGETSASAKGKRLSLGHVPAPAPQLHIPSQTPNLSPGLADPVLSLNSTEEYNTAEMQQLALPHVILEQHTAAKDAAHAARDIHNSQYAALYMNGVHSSSFINQTALNTPPSLIHPSLVHSHSHSSSHSLSSAHRHRLDSNEPPPPGSQVVPDGVLYECPPPPSDILFASTETYTDPVQPLTARLGEFLFFPAGPIGGQVKGGANHGRGVGVGNDGGSSVQGSAGSGQGSDVGTGGQGGGGSSVEANSAAGSPVGKIQEDDGLTDIERDAMCVMSFLLVRTLLLWAGLAG